MNYNLLKELLISLEQFENEVDNSESASLEQFGRFLALKQQTIVKDFEVLPAEIDAMQEYQLNILINIMVVHLYRYTKTYSRHIQNLPEEISLEEFGYLVSLQDSGSISQTKLIELNIHEKTSGIEIVKRLIKRNWIESIENTNDKRSKLLRLTDSGLQAIQTFLPHMNSLARLVVADLNFDQKLNLLGILEHLHRFHNPLFLDKSKMEVALADAYKAQLESFFPKL
jgi:MarR family transcriptional regulator, lower aerobic nicotinate degradation pathway regulator